MKLSKFTKTEWPKQDRGPTTRRSFLLTTAAAAAGRSQYPSQNPLYRAHGSHLELGRQHGEQAAAQIKLHLDYIGFRGRVSRERIRSRSRKFKPLFEQHCPHLLEALA